MLGRRYQNEVEEEKKIRGTASNHSPFAVRALSTVGFVGAVIMKEILAARADLYMPGALLASWHSRPRV